MAFGDFLKCKNVQCVKIYLCSKETSLVEMWLACLTESKLKRQHILETGNILSNIYKHTKNCVSYLEFSVPTLVCNFLKMGNIQNNYLAIFSFSYDSSWTILVIFQYTVSSC